MNKFIKTIILSFLLLGVINIGQNDIFGAEVNIPDDAFRACLNNKLGQESDAPITDTQLASISGYSSVICEDSEISDITGAEYLVNTYTIIIRYNNKVSDISPLTNLTKLKTLNLTYNQISDITPLSNLKDLTKLHIGGNNISDISALNGLTKLTDLDIYDNQISDLTPLQSLRSLKTLRAYKNQISDVSTLSNTPYLTTLVLNDNSIDDISVFSNLTRLDSLNISNNLLDSDDLGSISDLTTLTNLWMDDNQFTDVSLIGNLTNLVYLHLSNNQITDVTPLSELVLRELHLDGNYIRDLSPISTSNISWNCNFESQTIILDDIEIDQSIYTLDDNYIIGINGEIISFNSNPTVELAGEETKSAEATWDTYYRYGVWGATYSGNVTRNVTYNVSDPTIEASHIKVAKNSTLSDGDIITKSNALAKDGLDLDLLDRIIVSDRSSLDLSTTGVYLVELSVSDDYGNTVTATIEVEVFDLLVEVTDPDGNAVSGVNVVVGGYTTEEKYIGETDENGYWGVNVEATDYAVVASLENSVSGDIVELETGSNHIQIELPITKMDGVAFVYGTAYEKDTLNVVPDTKVSINSKARMYSNLEDIVSNEKGYYLAIGVADDMSATILAEKEGYYDFETEAIISTIGTKADLALSTLPSEGSDEEDSSDSGDGVLASTGKSLSNIGILSFSILILLAIRKFNK
ncbi:MAG: leucine-rich repeat domain-containing protein [Bacilli bacterium]